MRIGSNEHVIADPHGDESHLSFVESHWGPNDCIYGHYGCPVKSSAGVEDLRGATNLPMLTAVVLGFSFSPSATRSGFRHRSPRRWTPAMMTVLPPSMMFCLPSMKARREILLPVSYYMVSTRPSCKVKLRTYRFDVLSLDRAACGGSRWARHDGHDISKITQVRYGSNAMVRLLTA